MTIRERDHRADALLLMACSFAVATSNSVIFAALGDLQDTYGFPDSGLGPEIKGAKHPHWTATRNSSSTFGHFGGTGTFVWVDPVANVSCFALTNREFDEWALSAWPSFGDAVLDELGR